MIPIATKGIIQKTGEGVYVMVYDSLNVSVDYENTIVDAVMYSYDVSVVCDDEIIVEIFVEGD